MCSNSCTSVTASLKQHDPCAASLRMSEPLVVIGNGMAAMHLVEELTRRALGRYAIAVIGEEPRLAYNRVLLSAVLAQEVSRSEIELRPARWWSRSGRHTALRPYSDRNRPHHPPCAARRWGDIALRQDRACHWFATNPASRAGHGIARCSDLPRSRRCRHH